MPAQSGVSSVANPEIVRQEVETEGDGKVESLRLFNGKDTDNWEFLTDNSVGARASSGSDILSGGSPQKPAVFSTKRSDFRNFELTLEFKPAKGSNGGIFFHAPERWEDVFEWVRSLFSDGFLSLRCTGLSEVGPLTKERFC